MTAEESLAEPGEGPIPADVDDGMPDFDDDEATVSEFIDDGAAADADVNPGVPAHPYVDDGDDGDPA